MGRSRRFTLVAFAVLAAIGAAVAIWLLRADDEPELSISEGRNPHTARVQIIRTGRARPIDTSPTEPTSGGERIEGQVIDADGQPVVGATVFLRGLDKQPRTHVTEQGGAFVFDQLPRRSIRLSAAKDDLYTEIVVTTPIPTADPVTLHARRGSSLLVHVVDPDKKPLVGARVTNHFQDHVTDAAGTVRFGGLGPGRVFLRVSADGFAPGHAILSLLDDPGGVVETTIELARGALVSGTVIDPDGRPVGGANVDYTVGAKLTGTTTTSNADGTWSMTCPAGSLLFKASAPGYAATKPDPIEIDGRTPRAGVVIKVGLGGQIVGKVIDSKGQPAAGAIVEVEQAFNPRAGSTTTDALGKFRLTGLPTGKVTIRAQRGGEGSLLGTFDLPEDREVELELVLEPTEISGTVVDSRRQPIPDATVELHASGAGYEIKRSDAKGRFVFAGIPITKWRLAARRGEDPRSRTDRDDGIEVEPTKRDIELVVREVTKVVGRVVLDGKPVSYYGITILRDAMMTSFDAPAVVRSPEGRFTRQVAPGTWSIVIAGPGFAKHVVSEVAITEGKTIDLGDIAVDPGLQITGRVTDAGGPVPGARITLEGMPVMEGSHELQQLASGYHSTLTADDGRYTLTGLAKAGDRRRQFAPQKLTATHPTRGVSSPRYLEDVTGPIDFVLGATGTIVGTITGPRFERLSIDARTTSAKTYSSYNGTLDASGRFRIEGVPAGTYLVTAHSYMEHGIGDSGIPPARVTVVAGQETVTKLVIPSELVEVTFHAIDGECGLVTLSDADGSDEHRLHEMCTDGKAKFARVPPGKRTVCVNAKACQAVVIEAGRKSQTIQIHGRTD